MGQLRICENCGVEFTPRHRQRAGRFCSPACYYQHPRGNRVEKVPHRLVRKPGHPVAPPGTGTVAVARVTLYDVIGSGPHPCHWCGAPVDWMPGAGTVIGALIVDHLNHDSTDDRLENLAPACLVCNAHRTITGTRERLRDDELIIINPNGSRQRAVSRDCGSCGVTFVTSVAQVNAGKGRFCSRSCARSAYWQQQPATPPSRSHVS